MLTYIDLVLIKQKYGEDINFKITPLNKKDVYISSYLFMFDENYNVVKNISSNSNASTYVRVYDSEDDYDMNDMPANAYYHGDENVWCLDIATDSNLHIANFNEQHSLYEYYKKIFVDSKLTYLKQYGNKVSYATDSKLKMS